MNNQLEKSASYAIQYNAMRHKVSILFCYLWTALLSLSPLDIIVYNIDIMRSYNRDPLPQFNQAGWRQWVMSNGAILLFLLLALAGMVIVYQTYHPDPDSAEALVLIEGAQVGFSAPIYKEVAGKPVVQRLSQSARPTKIGIIAGHMGFDSGAVCDDGLTEVEININLAERLAARLQAAGIPVEILAEFDPRLAGYSATGLISIHADSCEEINELATGFKISGSPYTDSSQLSICMEQQYQQVTQLPYHPNSITPHMTNYHAFRQIAPGTQAIIIEVGFMNLDRELLTDDADTVVEGLARGVLCFLESGR